MCVFEERGAPRGLPDAGPAVQGNEDQDAGAASMVPSSVES